MMLNDHHTLRTNCTSELLQKILPFYCFGALYYLFTLKMVSLPAASVLALLDMHRLLTYPDMLPTVDGNVYQRSIH